MEMGLQVDVEDKDEFSDLFEERNVNCIASQETEGGLKFYFYCQEKIEKEYFLMEVTINDGDEFSMILKYSEDAETAEKVKVLVNEVLKNNNFI